MLNKIEQQYINTILEFKSNFPGYFLQKLRKLHPEIMEWFYNKCPNKVKSDKFTFYTKLFWIINELTDFPLCPYCGKTRLEGKNVPSFELGYFRACSLQCPELNKSRSKKTQETCLKKYGSTCYLGSKDGKQKYNNWCKEHGVTNAFQIEEIKEKSKKSRVKNFGCEFTMQSKEKQELAKKTYFEKTGFIHQFSNPEVRKKINENLDEKKSQGFDIYYKRRLSNRKKRYQHFLANQFISPNFSEDEFLKLSDADQYTTNLKWICKKCGSIIESPIDQNFSSREGIPVRCLKCFPILSGTSSLEKDIVNYISTCASNYTLIQNSKSIIFPYELDIYIPEKTLAIEVNGLYWHSDDSGKNRQYHLNKTELCEKQGIHLIHIFENEWILKQDIVKSRLKNLLGIYDKTIFARKCYISEINPKISKEFQDKNHIQGGINSTVNIGLYFDTELISLMTFSKCRFDKKHEWELVRFCNKLGYHIPGAASKLLKYFEQKWNPKSLVSYADRRWSQGKLYNTLGFNFSHNSSPNYWYFKNASLNLESRVKYQKHKLKDILENFDETKTEVQNMINNNYSRIFDCGNIVFEKIYNF